jgi:hypothetical protein
VPPRQKYQSVHNLGGNIPYGVERMAPLPARHAE